MRRTAFAHLPSYHLHNATIHNLSINIFVFSPHIFAEIISPPPVVTAIKDKQLNSPRERPPLLSNSTGELL